MHTPPVGALASSGGLLNAAMLCNWHKEASLEMLSAACQSLFPLYDHPADGRALTLCTPCTYYTASLLPAVNVGGGAERIV